MVSATDEIAAADHEFAATPNRRTAWQIAAEVPDPELPMVTLADLGILRDVHQDGTSVTVTITPTYSGCPAMREISQRPARTGCSGPGSTRSWCVPSCRRRGAATGSPTKAARKLAAAGIAPPHHAPQRSTGPVPLNLLPRVLAVACPRCSSTATTRTAQFSGTACKALYRCRDCREPFEYVKEI